MSVTDLAIGKWREILLDLGIEERLIDGKNRPCPLCGGKDRFRFLDHRGVGMWVCTQCQNEVTDGANLAMRFSGMSFKELAKAIEGKYANMTPTVREERDPRPLLRSIARKTRTLLGDCETMRYLCGRKVPPVPMLREADLKRTDDGRIYTTMVALVSAEDGRPSTYHLTYLQDGKKAEGVSRKVMPTALPPSAIRLHPVSETLGIAEGIETALACWKRFEVPTWAAIGTSLLAKWTPPEEVKRVVVFADNDKNYAGQVAAYKCANRLAINGLDVDVKIPEQHGDWADGL